MLVLDINNNTYRVFNDWSEITVAKARELFKLSNEAPEELLYIYKEQAKGEKADQDQINLRAKELDKKQSDLDAFFIKVLCCLSDIPADVISETYIGDVRAVYAEHLLSFVFGVLHFPLADVKNLDSFKYMGVEFVAPESKNIMGMDRPFYNEKAGVFCDASDLDSAGRKGEFGKYQFAEQILATIYRQEGVEYTEKQALLIADEYFKDVITCDIFHACLQKMAEVNSILSILFPNLYTSSGDIKSKHAAGASGLEDFGWLNSIMSIAETKVLTVQGSNMSNLECVRQTELYDFMTVLSNMRANSDFQRIYREQVQKDK